MLDKKNIMILCKVVDNFGDIGVVYRLARALSDARPLLNLTLVVSNLESFHALAPLIDPKKPLQDFRYNASLWHIVDWNIQTQGFPVPLGSVILECFQCGRPDWLENLLFSDDFSREVQILNIDYLTAEDYAEEFHLLKSGTRKANIKKRFFMPGFTEKTGGLIINKISGGSAYAAGLSAVPLSLHSFGRFAPYGTATPPLQSLPRSHFNIFFFAYEDDCAAVVRGITDFQAQMKKSLPDFSVCTFLADGKSREQFLFAWNEQNAPFKIEKIPFLPQEEFDAFLLSMDFLFVRGEDSLARAALSSIPFVWQAYKQDENYQLVKVNALLERMKDFFEEADFLPIRDFWQSYNDYEQETNSKPLTQMLVSSAEQKNTLGFKQFSEKLHKNGNLAEHLLAFIDSLD